MQTASPYPEWWRRGPPTAGGRRKAERRVRTTTTRVSRWGGTEGRSRGRRNPTPGQNTGPSSAKQIRIISLSASKYTLCSCCSDINHKWHLSTAATPTMRHVPVWVEAILQERGTTFPEISACSFCNCCSSDLERERKYEVFWWPTS